MKTCLVGIIENYNIFSSGIKLNLEAKPGIKVIGIGKNAHDLESQLNGFTLNIIIINVLHCNNGGVNLIKKTNNLFPTVPLLLITSPDYSECFQDYLKFGSRGFVFPNDKTEDLIEGIRSVCDGKDHFRENMKRLMDDNKNLNHDSGLPLLNNHSLTEREIEVIKFLCDGLTYKEIGTKLFISSRTVETHKRNIMSKLKVNTRAEMIKYATRNHYSTS